MIDQILFLVFSALAAPIVLGAGVWWFLSDKRKARRCRNAQHVWEPGPVRGAGGIGITVRCRHCPAEFIKHRGF